MTSPQDTATSLHNTAMTVLDEYLEAKADQDTEAAKGALRRALTLETLAAEKAPAEGPSKAILYRSATHIALELGDAGKARTLAGQGLELSDLPEALRVELQAAYDRTSCLHLVRKLMEYPQWVTHPWMPTTPSGDLDVAHPAFRGWILHLLREATRTKGLNVHYTAEGWRIPSVVGDFSRAYSTEEEALLLALNHVWMWG
jgi:hypothetical protein